MNFIEYEWLHLKCHELSSRIFDDEHELAISLIHAIENRANNGNYSVKRFIQDLRKISLKLLFLRDLCASVIRYSMTRG
jgi:hypothetical protein